jgi:3-dehydroquinate dehydratase-2
MAKHILLINGPNLNLLGLREPHLYGSTTLPELQDSLAAHCASLSPPVKLTSFQSNSEGAILDTIHSHHPAFQQNRGAEDGPPVDAVVINAGGLTHTSVVLRDALVGVSLPFVEVHITNVHARERFRHHSFMSEKAAAVICGLGTYGYTAAVEFLVNHHRKK